MFIPQYQEYEDISFLESDEIRNYNFSLHYKIMSRRKITIFHPEIVYI